MDNTKMVSELRADEGVVPFAYQDSEGYWTIGIGRLIDKRKGGKLSDDEMDYLLTSDIQRCVDDIKDEVWYKACDTDARQRALVNMRFQLGSAGLRGFVNSLKMISEKRWADAGANLRASRWYQQTPNRAERVIRKIETGQ